MKAPKVYNYQRWTGNQKFYLGGKIWTGPNKNACILTWCVINLLAVGALISYFVELFREEYRYPLLIQIALILVVNFTMYLGACTDPGSIPSRIFMEAIGKSPWDQLRNPVFVSNWIGLYNGSIIKMKFCSTCMIIRPPRAVHCN